MASLSSISPQHPLPGGEVTLFFNPGTGTPGADKRFRLTVTDAPPGSSLRAGLDAAGASYVVATEIKGAHKFTPETSGRYAFAVETLERTSHASPFVPIAGPNAFEVFVASKVEFPIAPSGLPTNDPANRHKCTLVIYVAGETVISTTTPETTPRLEKGTTSEARLMIDDPDVRSALAAMVTTGVSAIVAAKDNLITAWTTRAAAPSPSPPTSANAGAFALVELGGVIKD